MVLPITFVKASRNGRASSGEFRAIATSTTICSNMNLGGKVNAGSLPLERCSTLVSKAVIRLIVSLLGKPVHNLGGVIEPRGACKRVMNGGDVHYSVLSSCKGVVFRYTVSLVRLVQKYGTNIGNLRSRMRILLMRSYQYRKSCGVILVREVTESPIKTAARVVRAAMSHKLTGLTTVPVNFAFKGGVDILKAPEHVIHRSLFSEGLQNPFMLFKFYYPEVFRCISWADGVLGLRFLAAIGHFLRRGTPLEVESEADISIHYRNLAMMCGSSFEWFLDTVRMAIAPRVPFRIVPFSEDNPAGRLRMCDRLTHYLQLNHPRAALLRYPGHYDLLTQRMTTHPSYKECHLAFREGLPSQKRRFVPSTTH